MTVILTTDLLNNMIADNVLKVFKKNQKNVDNCNYYFTPSIGLSLYSPKVKYLDKKFLVFEFDKTNNINLLHMFRHINTILQNKIKRDFSEMFDKTIHDFFYEDDCIFTIRFYLPNYNGKYLVNVENDRRFYLPRIGCIYHNIKVEFRNVWKSNNKYGFNIELKNVCID
jgi:hypothetical protein